MPFSITTELTCYLLPDDGDAAKAEFLANLKNPYETWITAYAFTLEDMIDEILSAHAAGVKIHIYLDHSQSVGTAEQPQVKKLAGAGVDVTIGTSNAGKAFIAHTKGVVVDAPAPDGPWCWQGSVNFSETGWEQVNTATTFISQEWRDRFVAQFNELRDYAWANEPDFQVIPAASPVKDVSQS